MGFNLSWEPKRREKNEISSALNDIIRKRYGFEGKITIEKEVDYDYFLGLEDANMNGATQILRALDKYGCIEVTIES